MFTIEDLGTPLCNPNSYNLVVLCLTLVAWEEGVVCLHEEHAGLAYANYVYMYH